MNTILLTKKEFKTAMEVLPFVAKDEVRPILQCVNFKNNTIVAMDGYRLAERKITQSLEAEFNILGSDLKQVVKAIKKDTAYITIQYQTRTILFQLLDKEKNVINEFNLKEREGRYIKYESLIPDYHTIKLTGINSSDIVDSLKNIVSSTICFNIEKNSLNVLNVELNKHNTIIGNENNTLIDCTTEGENLEIALSKKYIKESLKNYKNYFSISFTGSISPIVIKSEDQTKLDLILPIRLVMGNSCPIIRDYKGEKLTSISDTDLKNLPF